MCKPSVADVMFPTARCLLLLLPQPRVVAVHGCLAPARMTVVASARRGGGLRDRSWDDDGGGGSGDEDAIDESFFGEPRDDDEEPEEERRRGRRPASPGEPQLRGSDVLRALQRAAAAKKEANKKKQQQQSKGARPAARRQGGGGVAAVQVAAGEVKPIEIRREWAPRIRELELRVQHLVDKIDRHPQES